MQINQFCVQIWYIDSIPTFVLENNDKVFTDKKLNV